MTVSIRTLLLYSLFLLPCLSFTPELSGSTKNHPNIILFLVDDLGWQDTSVPFHFQKTPLNDRFQTPNLERLAWQGMRFTNAYAVSPVCTPTRSSLMTGQHPARSHITNWTLRNNLEAQESSPKRYPLISPEWNFAGIQEASKMLPSFLKSAGYTTIHVGKAHWGALETDGANPLNLGYDVNIAGHAAGAPGSFLGQEDYGNAQENSPWGVPGLEKYHGTDTFLTDALTQELLPVLERAIQSPNPFFLNLAPYVVHVPLKPYEPFFSEFIHQGLDQKEAMYASMVRAYDVCLGTVLKKLEETGEAENTMFLFFSDNGGYSQGARGMTPMGTGIGTHNTPLKSGKGAAYEGGIRVPMIASWAKPNPKNIFQQQFPIQRNSINATPVVSQDLFSTILALGSIDLETVQHKTDGENLLPLFSGMQNDLNQRPLFFHYPHKWGPEGLGLDPFTAVRKGDWKLIYFYHTQTFELYNLTTDLSETQNLFDIEQEKAQELADIMNDWMQEVDAQTPRSRETKAYLPRPTL